MKSNGWLYHYYMMQSRLQYNIAYGGTKAANQTVSIATAAALYPQMMHHVISSPDSMYHSQDLHYTNGMSYYNSSLGFQDDFHPTYHYPNVDPTRKLEAKQLQGFNHDDTSPTHNNICDEDYQSESSISSEAQNGLKKAHSMKSKAHQDKNNNKNEK